MARPQAVFLASVIALSALFILSLLAVAGVDASPSHTDSLGKPILSAPAHREPLSISEIVAAQTPLTCTYTITTPVSDVTNNFSFATAASLAPYNNLTLLPSNAPPPLTTTVQMQYFRVDALVGYHYLVSAIPNSLSTYNLNIIVYNSSQTPVFTGTKSLGSLSVSIDFVPSSSGTYYFAVFHTASNCPTGTYKLTVDGPATATPTVTPTPGPTSTSTTAATALPGADRFEPNFGFDNAGLMALNVKYTELNFVPWSGADPYERDNDFYKVWVKPGLLVTCETLDLAAGVDTNLILYDNNRNGIGGNDDKDRANGDFGSRVSYYVTYEGYLYLLIGQPFAPLPNEVAGFKYAVECSTGDRATPTPTRLPQTLPPTNTPVPPTPTPVPTDTPSPTNTPPFIQVRPLPTVTPVGQARVLIPISLQVYYDANNNRAPDPGEGVVGVSARVTDVTTGQELQHSFTDEFGFASLTVSASGVVRLSVPYLNYTVVV
ncbi:MAG TPA: hypothetical protein VJ754_02925, partial [Anaerolineae bacterium]|nr:hypothetical protein [Anaerolineae bacterium]